MRILFENHREHAALQDVIALFFPQFEILEDGFQGSLPGGANAELTSRVSRLPALRELRGQEEGPPVQVETRLRDESMTAAVPPVLMRRELKRQIYIFLEKMSGIHWPWGSLTGIRPTQVARDLWLEKGEAAAAELCDYWQVSAEKAKLGLETAQAEDRILGSIPHDQLMVYAGVPFCPGRCSYCSFICRDAGRQADELHDYALAMVREAESVFSDWRPEISAFYMGGGTPTSFDETDFAYVLENSLKELNLREGAEITVEAGRPDTISEAKLRVMKALGVTRICINPQSLNEETLIRVGRFHDTKRFYDMYNLARRLGFDDINCDLILGLPGENGEDFNRTVERLLAIEPDSITIHTLALKRSARLEEEEKERFLPLRFPDPALQETLRLAQERVRAAGYAPYYLYRQKNVRGGLENTGFARDGKVCVYNVGMMSDEISIVGLGSGSSSKRVTGRRVERMHNSKDLRDYRLRIEEFSRRKREFFASL